MELEKKIIGKPSAERMSVYHKVMTSKPHHAGTEANFETADYYAERLREFGFDEIIMNHYEVLLPRPMEREVTLIAPEPYSLKLFEPPILADPDSKQDGVLPTFNAYSADGDVTSDVVYVNYGIPKDYEVLDSLGISVEGKIVIARYLKSWRGIKSRLAAEHGAIGCLIYSDPADDGFVRGDVIPKGKWRPEHGVQRGSVMDMPTYPGDPQTPMVASKKGVNRISLDEVTTFQKIPVQPISYGDALPILRNLGGKVVPEQWRGGLPVTYHFGPGPARVHIKLKFDWSVRPIMNVIGILRGNEQPQKIVMAGGHRDAWTFGGRDPISGAVSLLECARIFGELAKQGYRAKRSIAFASWDAEEYGLIGSTEYGEEFGKDLQGNLVVYLNRESYTAGDFGAGGVHSLQPFINQVVQSVYMPDNKETVFEAWMKESETERIINFCGNKQVRIGALGSGSDYTVFLDHLGIPAMNIVFSSGNGIYHSRYDSHWFFTTFGDPDFKYGVKLSEIAAIFLMRMAQADILPFDYAATAETIDRYIDELEKEIKKRKLSGEVDISGVRAANRQLTAAATVLNKEITGILSMGESKLKQHKKSLRKLNDIILAAEMAFLHQQGLPRRPWFRHQIYAPGYYTGYGVKTLPGVREAIERNDVAEAKKMAGILEKVILQVRAKLLEAIVVAAGSIK
ncbi:MAG: M28 family peptidase [bacterium]|nr:MAG: M28 family peptidase [bacterium]